MLIQLASCLRMYEVVVRVAPKISRRVVVIRGSGRSE